MTIKEKLKKMLTDRGINPVDADEVLVIAIPQFEDITSFRNIALDSSAEGYPGMFYGLIWKVLRRIALEWIDENRPEAWYRPAFK